MTELLPCPFCGKFPYITENNTHRGTMRSFTQWWVAGCEQCGICFRGGSNKELAISFWNTRANLPETQLTMNKELIDHVANAIYDHMFPERKGTIYEDEWLYGRYYDCAIEAIKAFRSYKESSHDA